MNKIYTLTEYISSDGHINNYVLEEIGHQGYLDLCQESINKIENLVSNETDSDKLSALVQLKESYLRTIRGEQTKSAPQLEPHVKYLKHCKILKTKNIYSPEAKEHKYRNNVTKYKAEYRKILPMKNYIGLIKLADDKFTSITEGDNSEQEW